jgi:hypothetical protein
VKKKKKKKKKKKEVTACRSVRGHPTRGESVPQEGRLAQQ